MIIRVRYILLVAILIGFGWFIFWRNVETEIDDVARGAESALGQETEEPEVDVDAQIAEATSEAVSAWAGNRNVGVLIRNIDTGETLVNMHSDRVFFAASLYKLKVVTDSFVRVQEGQNPHAALNGGRSWAQCMDVSIRISDNPCAEALWLRTGQVRDEIMNVSANDVYQELMRIWRGSELSAENRALYLDSMLNQPDDQRLGLPFGFSSDVRVYNKVGWLGDRWHDAAIVVIDGRHFAVVVLTRGVGGSSVVSELGVILDRTLRGE
ncbi:serine hydrolase [Candidatus Saccharibacteria bacterium]|nr:serine hydrolase [Candidatus Saccharibacteria bacterium]